MGGHMFVDLFLTPIAWVSGVSGEKGKNGSENLLSPCPVGRPDTQAITQIKNAAVKKKTKKKQKTLL